MDGPPNPEPISGHCDPELAAEHMQMHLRAHPGLFV